MAEFKLGRIRFVWKGGWTTATAYYKDDVIRYGGRTYICQIGHTSASDFNTDLEFSPTKWNQMTDGQEWKGDWTTDTFYKISDVVKYGGLIYICNDSHTSASTTADGLELDQAKWDLFAEGFDWKGDWALSTRYKVNDLVSYGGYTYVCNTAHTSAATLSNGLELDQAKWDVFNPGISYSGTWTTGTRYKVNDVVKYGGGLYIATSAHTASATFDTDSANWADFVQGIQFEDDWSVSSTYQKGDIVRYGGNQYLALQYNIGANPLTATLDWVLYSEGFRWQASWSISTSYKIGEVVGYNGNSYLATVDSPSFSLSATASSNTNNRFTVDSTTGLVAGMVVRFSGTTFGGVATGATYYIETIPTSTEITIRVDSSGSTFVPTTATGTMTATVAAPPTLSSYYSRLNSGMLWQGEWSDDFEYRVGDTVRYGSNAYICIKDHRSEGDDGSTGNTEGGGSPNSRPDQDLTGVYWNLLSIGTETSVLTTRGDLVYYGGAGPTRLPIGIEGQVLRAGAQDPEWVTLGNVDYTYFVAPHGQDHPAPIHGKSFDKPWKTIRYACEQVENGPRNPNAKRLLELNRVFIQREVVEWVDYQISTSGSGFDPGFDYDEYKCERDVGYIVDALIYDLGHGGNVKMRGAANSYVGGLSETEIEPYGVGLSNEATESVAALNYMLEVATAVLNQQAPAVNYQVLNGDNSTAIVSQFFDPDITAESGTVATVTALTQIVTDAITAGTADDIPARFSPNNLINVATGQYREVLPIIVPEQTCVKGDELRSTNAGPRTGTTPKEDAFFTSSTLGHINAVVQDIVQGNSVTPTSGNTATQSQSWPYATSIEADIIDDVMKASSYAIEYRTGYNLWPRRTSSDPTNYNTSYLTGYGNARYLIRQNKEFFKAEVTAWISTFYPNLKYSKTKCKQDVGYIVDAMLYDLTYGGNAMSVQAGLAYWEGASRAIDATEVGATAGAYAYLKTIMQSVANASLISRLNSTVVQYTSGTAGSAGSLTFIGTNMDTIINIVTNGTSGTYTLTDPSTSWVAGALTSAYSTLNAAVATIKTNTTNYINANFPTLVYDSAKCERDIGIILKAVGYDFMFDNDFQTVLAGRSYLRSTASEVFSLGQKEATRSALEFVRTQAIANVGGDVTAIARINSSMDQIDYIIFSGSIEGSRCATPYRTRDYAVLQIERNRDFLIAESNAYIANTFKATITDTTATSNILTIGSGLNQLFWDRNVAVRFTGTVFGGISANTTYYIQYSDAQDIKISTSKDSNTPVTLTTASGSMTMELVYDEALCERDVQRWLDAVKFDLKYPGNYKTQLCARYYANAVVGSLEEDMYYLRDATGVRDMTLEGLTGDLLPENEYGTSRVSAGAYCSLDPGWGPEDYRTWIITRSPYVQGVTTIGYGAIGQKIDGALHNGGNDSIVSNDFTQVISDGIGAWVANNGRAELVSVFTYYAHIGYLSTEGGRIRGTNGNCSYGDFGAVAEGFDSTETPNTAVVDNRTQFVATINTVFTNGSQMFRFEYDNAGIDYTEATWTLTGGGSGANALQNEFRDDGVYQVRLLDLGDDSSGQFGGDGYITNSNTAQGGTTSSITLAATDGETSTAYIGMKVVVTGGAGVGQIGIIATYNSGTKLATVVKESDGTSGWDHMVTGTTIVSPDASSTYTVEPRLTFSDPGFTTVNNTLSVVSVERPVTFGQTNASYVSLSGTYSGSTGAGALFTVVRNGWRYNVTLQNAGSNYVRLETITIDGTDLGGTTGINDLTITITAVSEAGAILEFDQDGYGTNGRFVAATRGSQQGYYSNDGETWTSVASMMPSTANWTSMAAGSFDDGSSTQKIGRFVAVSGVSSTTAAAWSEDGISWNATTMPVSTTWTHVKFGSDRFMAISSAYAGVAISLDGEVFDIVASTPITNLTGIAYGKDTWVVVKSGDTNSVAYSTDGGLNWTAANMPANVAWSSVTYGNNIFVAVASDSNSGAYSLDGQTWVTMTMGSVDGSTIAGYQKVEYGQGLFMATTYEVGGSADYSFVSTSPDGLTWTAKGVETPASVVNNFAGWYHLAFGTPQRTGKWALMMKDSGAVSAFVRTGAPAKGRAQVAENKIFAITIVEPGSGYDSAPTLTVTDPNNTYEVPHTVRVGKGVLANPTWISRGSQYVTGSAEINTGDGIADNYQPGSFVAVRRLSARPVPGSNVVFSHLPNRTFKLVNVITFLGSNDGAYTAFFQVSPDLSISEAPDHLEDITTRIRYSQVRLTGHDFLDIGTGSFAETNYPNEPTQDPIPANETNENNGGRVFFTATDQDGNFRVGELFAIEQSTGVATLNADAFNISGLQELNLGNVTLGGGSATVTEFSTDPFFTADSDNIVPTQRAIKAYIASQIGGGGASLNVNSVTAGSIFINSNQITTTTGTSIVMAATFEFRAGVTGIPLALNYFLS